MSNDPAVTAVSPTEADPLLTVAMPIYNGGGYLRLAVLSIIRQTFTDWELLIIDDGSTDNALQGIADIVDPRIKVIRDGSNRGLAVRLNQAIDLARGRYFARMDHDDVSYPRRFARQIMTLQNDPQLDLLATRALKIAENDQAQALFPWAISHEEICARPWWGFYFPHPTWMGRTEWFRKHRYTEPGPYFSEDQELLLRSHCDSRFATLNEILVAYRIRSKVDWPKIAKIRRTIFLFQWRYFTRLKQWSSALLAVAGLLVKLLSDLLKRSGCSSWQVRNAASADALIQEWNETLAGLRREAKAP